MKTKFTSSKMNKVYIFGANFFNINLSPGCFSECCVILILLCGDSKGFINKEVFSQKL